MNLTDKRVDEVTKMVFDKVVDLEKKVDSLTDIMTDFRIKHAEEMATVKTQARFSGMFIGTLFSGIVGCLFYFIKR